MKRELYPLFEEEDDYILPIGSMYAIGHSSFDTDYVYSVCEWANGFKGAIVDLFEVNEEVDDNGKPLFEHPFGFRDNLYFVSETIDLAQVIKDPMKSADLWIRCPMIAEGIIARFAKTSSLDRNFAEMYEMYYKMEKSFYILERQRSDPYVFNTDLDDEFINGVHLQQEQEKIEFSLQVLLPFLQEKDQMLIKQVAEAYIAFVKSKATRTMDTQNVTKDKTPPKRVRKEKKDETKYSFLLNVNNTKLETLYVMLSKRDDKGNRFIDGDLMKINKVDDDILSRSQSIKDENMRNTAINKYLFNQVFSGQETDVRIVWTSDTNKLWYFIKTLYNYNFEITRGGNEEVIRLLEKRKDGPGIWQLVCLRFMNGKPRKVFDERTGKKVVTTEPIDFEEKDFYKYCDKNSPRDTSLLDVIINKIAPPRVKIDKEVIEEDTKLSKYGIQAPDSAEQLGEGFHDTSHKGKFE